MAPVLSRVWIMLPVDGHPFRDPPARRVAGGRIKPASRSASLWVLAVFTVLWNSVVWFMLFAMLDESVLAVVFLSIFLIAGLGLAVVTLHQFLAIFNPTIELYVSEPQPALGETLDVRWHVAGRAHRIKALKVELIAVEQATYQRGTDTTTDHHVFVRHQLAHTDARGEIRDGSATVVIPHTVPTFTAKNNKIVWKVVIGGDIPRWPDIDDEFELTVIGSKLVRKAA